MKLNAKELRQIDQEEVRSHAENLQRRPLFFILENIYDTYNIGGLFRLADALAVTKMYICGDTEIPPNHKIVKASVGTYKVVPWEYKKTAKEAIEKLKLDHPLRQVEAPLLTKEGNKRGGISIIAVEQDEKSVPYQNVEYTTPIALLLGNETYGVLPETLKEVDQIVEIPMWGINKSLNVIVSAAIVSYHLATK